VDRCCWHPGKDLEQRLAACWLCKTAGFDLTDVTFLMGLSSAVEIRVEQSKVKSWYG
jgi:hypothetical protein